MNWKMTDIKFLKENYLKYSNYQLSHLMGRSEHTIAERLSELELRRSNSWKFWEYNFVRRTYQYASNMEISNRLGARSRYAVGEVGRRLGLRKI